MPELCLACGDPLSRSTSGRPPKFCSAACRQAAFRRRNRSLPLNTPRHPGGGRYSLRRRELALLFAQWEEELDCQLTHDERAALEWQRFLPAAAHPAVAAVHSMTEYDALLHALEDLYD